MSDISCPKSIEIDPKDIEKLPDSDLKFFESDNNILKFDLEKLPYLSPQGIKAMTKAIFQAGYRAKEAEIQQAVSELQGELEPITGNLSQNPTDLELIAEEFSQHRT